MNQATMHPLYYATGEQIQAGDIVLHLSCNNERYEFERPLMKVWDIVRTKAGKVIGVALMHPSVDSPAIYLRVLHTASEEQQTEQAKTFGELSGGYMTTDTLITTLDIDKLLCLLIRREQISEDQEKNQQLINAKIAERIKQNYGLALFYQAKLFYQQREFESNIAWLEKALRVNFTPAMCDLAVLLAIGRGVDENQLRSFVVLQHASSLGDAIATYKLAENYAQGRGTTADLNKSFQYLELAVKQGSWKAILTLGSYYRFGWLSSFLLGTHHQGYRKINQTVIDPNKAFYHYAYIVNHAPKTEVGALMNAQYHLGWMYQDGIGVEQDYEQAVNWYQQSSDLGNFIATNNLADKYEHGLGVEQDLDMAFALYSSVAEQVVAANLALGRMYLQGRGVEQNLALAKKHLEEVLNGGADQIEDMQQEAWLLLESFAEDTVFKRVQKMLACTEDFSLEEMQQLQFKIEAPIPNPEQLRFQFYLEMAKKGDVSAQSQVGDWYLRGIGTDVDIDRAFIWIHKAYKKQNWYAYYQMGYLYEYGIAIQQDLKKAETCYQSSLQDVVSIPKQINGKPNPRYEEFYRSMNKDALIALERIKQTTPKWMFWKK